MRRWHKWLIGIGVVFVTLFVAGTITAIRLQPRVKARVEKLLSDRFDSDVDIKKLTVSLFPIAGVTAHGVSLRRHYRTDVPPLIEIRKFSARSDLASLLLGAQHDVNLVKLEGLRITIPSGTLHRKQFQPKTEEQPPGGDSGDHFPFLIREIQAHGTALIILPKQQGKIPLEWDMEKLVLHSVGSGRPMEFVTTLTNAKPPGVVESKGHFGPWQKRDPGASSVGGHYTFHHADLGVFKGISGILSSVGDYDGSLDEIDVKGTTNTPDFQVGNGNPVDLKTKFSATVDGTSGDTFLHPVDATFMQSEFICNGDVVGTPGIKGKKVSLDVQTKGARMEDILLLVLNTKKSPFLGQMDFKSKLLLPQGNIPVIQKLFLDGQFSVRSGQFTADKLQDKLDTMSNRSMGLKGRRAEDDVATNLHGKFVLKDSTASFSHLSFDVPGIFVSLYGSYGLTSEKIDFHGTARLHGKISQMTTGWKSILLKPVDPFFRKDGGGTVLPIKVTGSKSDPDFGLELHRDKK